MSKGKWIDYSGLSEYQIKRLRKEKEKEHNHKVRAVFIPGTKKFDDYMKKLNQ